MDQPNIKRNDPCPCGSGKKFKNCHMGREAEIPTDQMQLDPGEVAIRIGKLPQADNPRAQELVKDLVFTSAAGRKVRIKLVDLDAYRQLTLFGSSSQNQGPGGVMINPFKTRVLDPDHIYIALSPDADESTVLHEVAHVADLIEGSGMQPERGQAVSQETGLPPELTEHPQEYGERLLALSQEMGIELDAEDEIVAILARRHLLIPGKTIARAKHHDLVSAADKIMRYMDENRDEIDARIKSRPGYVGKPTDK
jgi:hypothetical protein